MNVNELSECSCEVRRVIHAPVAVVFRAWTDPAVASRWSWGSEYETISIELDCQIGARWQQHIRNRGTGENWYFDGVFQDVRTNEKIVHTFHFRSDRGTDEETSLTTIEFIPEGPATEVVIKHTQLPSAKKTKETHDGWVEVLECVERCVAA